MFTFDERVMKKKLLCNPKYDPNRVRIGPLIGALQNSQFITLK
jgi:hypothetical protein